LRTCVRELEPLIACHMALLDAAGASRADISSLWLRAARTTRRCGDSMTARSMLYRAAEELRRTDGMVKEELQALVMWQSAKLLWVDGGAAKAEAVRLARALHAMLGRPGSRLSPHLMAMRVRVARRHGGWLDDMRLERRGAVEEVLLGAQRLADELSPKASAKAHYALGSFYQRQHLALREQGASAGALRARVVRSKLESELRGVLTQRMALDEEEEMATVASRSRLPADGRSSQGNAAALKRAKQRRMLADLERNLRRKMEQQLQHGGDDAAAEAESADYAEHALLSFLFSITADRMPAAAAAAASLWTEHAESLPSLNGLLETQVNSSAMRVVDFLPFVPQLIARAGLDSGPSAIPGDEDPHSRPFATALETQEIPTRPVQTVSYERALSCLLRQAARADPTEAVRWCLFSLCTPRGEFWDVPRTMLSSSTAEGRRAALAASLAVQLHADAPARSSSVEKLRDACLALASRAVDACDKAAALATDTPPASLAAAVAVDAQELFSLCGNAGQSLLALLSGHTGAPSLERFERSCRVVGLSPQSLTIRLCCVDASGTRHPLSIRVARRAGGFRAHAEAILSQALSEVHSHARTAGALALPILPLCHNTALSGWVEGGVIMGKWLEREHADAHASGIDYLSQAECEHMLRVAQARDKEACRHVASEFGGGPAAALTALRRAHEAIRPLLHRWLMPKGECPAQWLKRRADFRRSLGAASVSAWAVGIPARPAHSMLLEQHAADAAGILPSARIVHLDLQAPVSDIQAYEAGQLAEIEVTLPSPKGVPFRLTREMVDALGPCGVDTVAFVRMAVSTLKTAFASRERVGLILRALPRLDAHRAALELISSFDRSLINANVELSLHHTLRRLEGNVKGAEAVVKDLIADAVDECALSGMHVDWRCWL